MSMNLPTEIPDGFMGMQAAVGLVSPPGEPARGAVPLWSITRDTLDHSVDASNFAVAYAAMHEADPDNVIIAETQDWAHGWVRTIRVTPQVAGFTPAWVLACRMMLALMTYPVLDEADLADRQAHAFEEWFNNAITYLLPHYEHDTSEQVSLIAGLAREALIETSSYVDVIGMDTDQLEGFWAAARDDMFDQLAREYLTAQIPGQGALL